MTRTNSPAPQAGPGTNFELKAALMSARDATQASIAEYEATVTELTGQTDVDSLLERELAEDAVNRALVVLVDIDRALSRLEADTYGLCESCGVPIPVERLEAIPHARACVSCG
jgi:DnaK suppressor protein